MDILPLKYLALSKLQKHGWKLEANHITALVSVSYFHVILPEFNGLLQNSIANFGCMIQVLLNRR